MTPTTLNMLLDPHPSLPDSPLWGRLLPAAFDLMGRTAPRDNLAVTLHGLRCAGAALERLPDGRVRLGPGMIEPELWAEWRSTWLWPKSAELNQLLRELAETMRKMEAQA